MIPDGGRHERHTYPMTGFHPQMDSISQGTAPPIYSIIAGAHISTTYRAPTVLGTQVPLHPFQRTVPAYAHIHPRDWRADPVTGKNLWVLDNGRDTLESLNFGTGPTIDVIDVGNYESGLVVVGIVLGYATGEREDGKQSARSAVPLDSILDISAHTKKRLELASLDVSDANFGLHTVVSVG